MIFFETTNSLYLALLKIQTEYSMFDSAQLKNPFVDNINKIIKRCNKYAPKNKSKTKQINEEKKMNIYELYTYNMKKYCIGEFSSNKNTFKFESINDKIMNNGGQKIMEEITGITKSAPIMYDSSIFTKFDPANILLFISLITGPKDTPYSNGCFIFSINLPKTYPNKCPHVTIITTGRGKVRFNPNLYENGKVCLSLLGTWEGHNSEKWNPSLSTIQQVLISIQSLILVDDPYFNEPGYQSTIGTPSGISASKDYNDNIRLQTMKWGILDHLKNPLEEWKYILNNHFYYKKDDIIKTCQTWVNETSNKEEYEKVFNDIKNHLSTIELLNEEEEEEENSDNE